MIPTFVISMKSAAPRRAYMTQQLNALALPFQFMDAVEGAKLTEAEIDRVYDPSAFEQGKIHFRLNANEIGCALSHMSCWRNMVELNIPFCLIIEDDIVIAPDLVRFMPEIVSALRPQDVLLLNPTHEQCYFFRQHKIGETHRIVYINQSVYTAWGYIIGMEAARRLLSHRDKFYAPIDFWYSSVGFKGATPIRAILPALVIEYPDLQNQSQIGQRESQRPDQGPVIRRSLLRRWIRAIRLPLKNRFLQRPVRFD